MIPLQLTLRNFLSYRDASLDFQGLSVACISGANGAGKSSLLEAIPWAIWGHSRVTAEDDVIHMGALEAQVDLTFEHQRQTYRVLRTRRRNQGGALEFQVHTQAGFRPLTQRGMRATQQLICQTLRLDYDTFVNAAYLRQGRADEFMLKRPSERKQVLAELLKLGEYDRLAEKAKERARDAKAEVLAREAALLRLEEDLQSRSVIAFELQTLEKTVADFRVSQAADQAALSQWQQQQQQLQLLLQTEALQQQQLQQAQSACDRLQQEQARLQALRQKHTAILAEEPAIQAGLDTLEKLAAEEESLVHQCAQQEALQADYQPLLQTYQEQQRALQDKLQQHRLQLEAIDKQITALAALEPQPGLEKAAAALQAARDRLQQLDQLQLRVSPLQQRQQTLQRQLDQAQAELAAQLGALSRSENQLKQKQAQYPQLQQAIAEVSYQLEDLTGKRAYQEKVREKGIERRHFMERLQAEQRACEQQLSHSDQKLQLLQQPNAQCPVCDHPLQPHTRQHIIDREHSEKEEILRRIWGIREQLAVSEREIQVLRQEYRELEAALAAYSQVIERRGHLLAQLSSRDLTSQQLEALMQERSHLESCLTQQAYACESQVELKQLSDQLSQLAYDERDHALARGQVDRLRWADIKQAEIRQAKAQRDRLTAQRGPLQRAIASLKADLSALEQSETAQQLTHLRSQMALVNYDSQRHQQIRTQLRAAQPWPLRHQELEQTRQELPRIEAELATTQQQLQQAQAHRSSVAAEAQALAAQLAHHPDAASAIDALQEKLRKDQHQRESALSKLGALQQQQQQLAQQQQQWNQQQEALQRVQRTAGIYHELFQAFGRNGLQALIIEHILPHLEAEANHILGRLSAHQLHVQFVTQRVGRGRQGKLIETLDILIADSQGTRPYDTYSGGEAFRVNFAIRLALARLLAQRSGTPLQMLIIDEGFGTQDRDGCERLVAAINAISSDFDCILAVTHIPHFRETFQNRIDIVKTAEGSQIQVSA